MPNTDTLLQMIAGWLHWLDSCLHLPMATAACRPFWMAIVYACAAIGTALLIWPIWLWIDYRLKYRAALRAQAEREAVAAPEVMAAARFTEAGDVAEDVTDPQLAAKIRAELDRQRLARLTGRPGTNLPK